MTRSLSVLIVDDVADLAQTLSWMIEALGHATNMAFSADEAIEKAVSGTPDVVLMDIGLPGKNGYEACAEMRKMPSLSKTIFIAQTGRDDAADRMAATHAGFHAYLVKPTPLDRLQDILTEIAEGR